MSSRSCRPPVWHHLLIQLSGAPSPVKGFRIRFSPLPTIFLILFMYTIFEEGGSIGWRLGGGEIIMIISVFSLFCVKYFMLCLPGFAQIIVCRHPQTVLFYVQSRFEPRRRSILDILAALQSVVFPCFRRSLCCGDQ